MDLPVVGSSVHGPLDMEKSLDVVHMGLFPGLRRMDYLRILLGMRLVLVGLLAQHHFLVHHMD